MAQYYLKYFAEIQNFRGQMARVEIHQRDTAPAAVLQIGDVCGLELEIQGSTEEIYVPIVKTQARLSMVSSDDKPTAGGIKYGDWGEFYTPDSSLYKFVLKTKPTAEASAWTTRWTGYITPDSWQEGLDYRSPITIIARDNIGHLQDFDFDMNPADEFGLASIRSILAAAMEKIDFPMDYITDSAPETLQADETDILDALVSISHFEGENWYSVVESILDSIGYTLRYTDNNRFTLAPVRYLPLLGETSEAAQREIADLEFFGGTGEIVPAVKKIIEEVNYDYESEVPLRIKAEHLWTAEKTYHCVVRSLGVRMPFIDSTNAKYRNLTSNDGTVWKTGSSGNDVADLWKPGTPSLVTLAMEGENWNNYVFLAANGYDSETENDHRAQTMQFNSATSDLTIRFYFHRHPVSILENLSQTEANGAVVLGDMFGRAGLAKVAYIIKITDNSNIIRFWNDKTKSWEETRVINEQEFDPETLTTDVAVPLGQCPDITGDCTIDFTFVHIEYILTTQLYIIASDFNGCYARLSNVTIESNAVNLKSNAVRTINDEKYNVLINRKPEIAPLSRQVAYTHPANYPSALFYFRAAGDILPKPYPYAGNWSGITGTVKPLPVLIHQQLLCYRGANLWQLSGDCAPIERGLLYFDTILRYKNRRYIIKSGTMDFTTGTFGGAVLREFLEYDDIWDDRQQGDWSDTSNYNTIGGEVSGGGGSGAGAGSTGYYGGGVNYFEEDGNGGIKLKDKYAGLWVPGYLANGGIGSDSESGGGIDLDRVWESLTNNTDKPDVEIHLAHIPDITISKVTGLADALAQAGKVKSVVGLTGEITRQQLNSQIATSSITSGSDLLATSGGVYTYVNSVLSSAIKYRGITTTALTDGATTNPIIIDGESFTASLGDEVIYGGKEFLFTGGKWQQLGDEESWALKTISITGTGYLTGGGTLESDRTLDLSADAKTKLEAGSTIYGYFSNGILGNSHLPSMYIGRTAVAFSPANTTLLGITAISNQASSGNSDTSRIEWDGEAWHFHGNLQVDGWLACGGVGSDSEGGGIVERIHRYNELDGTFSQTENDVFDAYTVNQLHLRIRELEQHPGGVTSVAGYTGAVTVGQIASALTSAGHKLTDTTYSEGTGISISGTNVISINSTYDTYIGQGHTAYGWGNHASAGYLKSSDLDGYATQNWVNNNFNYYVHPTNGADVTITAASGRVLSAITVNSLGHVTSVASKTLAAADIPALDYLPLTGGTLTGDLRLKTGNSNYGSTLRFGDGDYAYLAEDEDDHLSIYASKGLTFSTGSSYGIKYGNGVLKWDANNDAWHLEGNLYVDGFLACGGIGSGDDGEISGEKTFLDVVTFADETLFEEPSVFEAGLTSMGISIANVASYRRINCAADRLYIQQSVSQDLVLTNGNNSHTIVGGYVSPGSYKLYVNGTARASSWDISSDCRLKDKIEDVCSDRALAVLMALRPKEWNWNEKNDYLYGKRGAGFIAQEVQDVLPFAVNDSGDYLSLNYTVLHAYEIAGWQNHEARIAELEKKISHA